MAPTRSTTRAPAKRRNKRKARTEVSSDSESDSEASSSAVAAGKGEGSLAEVPAGPASSSSTTTKAQANDPDTETEEASARLTEHDDDTVAPRTSKREIMDPRQAFRDFYLKQATGEFANDLDKLRSAGDFGGKSIGLLVGALEQGGACFGAGERGRVGVAGVVGRV
ncbi:hypothetical protein LTS14_002404 [Recurvomyces mirabilis]|uniref:uncharacterized protein n=1 Tax=Recurvomyces mirabilis TaxID=574656 RepID=UPI002DDEB609|nr:hypothetical protein LTS14_002404 [Recurvomyces mirabilis]